MSRAGVCRYHLFRAAHDRFGAAPRNLTGADLDRAEALADRTHFIETRILQTSEGRNARVPDAAVSDAKAHIAARFETETAFRQALHDNGLDEATLVDALRRQLRADAALQAVAASAPAPSGAEIAAAYARHRETFHVPERRRARHILITVNADFPENTPAAARARIDSIHARLRAAPDRFEIEAQTHSECPTALQGGDLGPVARGSLAPELDRALFLLEPGAISPVIETALGFHVLRCDAVTTARRTSLADAHDQIANAIHEARRAALQRRWIKEICGKPAATAAAQ